MIIGVPKEIKIQEFRVALLPSAAYQLVKRGHQVIVEKNAGAGIGYSDSEYEKAGAKIGCLQARSQARRPASAQRRRRQVRSRSRYSDRAAVCSRPSWLLRIETDLWGAMVVPARDAGCGRGKRDASPREG